MGSKTNLFEFSECFQRVIVDGTSPESQRSSIWASKLSLPDCLTAQTISTAHVGDNMMHCSRQYRTAGLQCNFFGPSKHTTCPSCPHIPSIPTINLHSLGSPRRPPASALYPVLESKTRSCFAASALFTLPDHLGDPCSALVLGSERALSGSIALLTLPDHLGDPFRFWSVDDALVLRSERALHAPGSPPWPMGARSFRL